MPRPRKPYPSEFREQLVALVRAGRTPEDLAREFEPTAQSISNWVAQADRDAGRRTDGLTTTERAELTPSKPSADHTVLSVRAIHSRNPASPATDHSVSSSVLRFAAASRSCRGLAHGPPPLSASNSRRTSSSRGNGTLRIAGDWLVHGGGSVVAPASLRVRGPVGVRITGAFLRPRVFLDT